jgi:hypothetical protein
MEPPDFRAAEGVEAKYISFAFRKSPHESQHVPRQAETVGRKEEAGQRFVVGVSRGAGLEPINRSCLCCHSQSPRAISEPARGNKGIAGSGKVMNHQAAIGGVFFVGHSLITTHWLTPLREVTHPELWVPKYRRVNLILHLTPPVRQEAGDNDGAPIGGSNHGHVCDASGL